MVRVDEEFGREYMTTEAFAGPDDVTSFVVTSSTITAHRPDFRRLFPSRLFPVPPKCVFPTFPVPRSAQFFSSHLDVRTEHLPLRNSDKC